MNHFPGWPLAALFCAPLGACSHADMMSDGYPSLQSTLTDAEAETQQHADACQTAPSTSAMMSELTRHQASMNGIMAHMAEARGYMADGSSGMGLRHCSGSSFDHMSSTVDDARSTMTGHVDRMRSAASLEAARSECSSHARVMDDLIQGMMNDLQSMSCTRK